MFRFVSILSALFLLTSCGKYGPPKPPEFYSADVVRELELRPMVQGLEFRWKAPENDRRGEELRSMDGYRVFRKELKRPSDLLKDDGYEEIGFVEDLHIRVRDERREAAEEQGLPTRKVQVEDELKRFSFLDTSPEAGKNYLYKIVPINQDGIEGATDKQFRVLFRGTSSEVQIVGPKS